MVTLRPMLQLGGEEDFVHVAHFAHEALEDGRVFRVDRQDGDIVAGGGIGDYLSGYHHSLLIGQGNGFMVFDGAKGGAEAGKSHDGGQHHVDRVHLHKVGDGVHACKDLNIVRGESLLHLLIFVLVGNGHSVGVKFQCLLYQ